MRLTILNILNLLSNLQFCDTILARQEGGFFAKVGVYMKSMTGYGKAVSVRGNRELTIELKSVNHRFLDISTKIPRMFIAHEDIIRNVLSGGLSRGHVDVFLNYKPDENSGKQVSVDMGLAESYAKCASQLSEKFLELKNDFTLTNLMRMPDVLSVSQADEDEQVLREMLEEAMSGAVSKLNDMREVEGNKLRKDLLEKIDNIEKLLQQIKQYAPIVAEQYRAKLTERVTEALNSVQIDEGKLANEVCFFADKSCIDEEITRLTSHIAHAREILNDDVAVGRKLDFLVQEFNRETNTICSKSAYLELTNVALQMKNEIEKLREQVQNLE